MSPSSSRVNLSLVSQVILTHLSEEDTVFIESSSKLLLSWLRIIAHASLLRTRLAILVSKAFITILLCLSVLVQILHSCSFLVDKSARESITISPISSMQGFTTSDNIVTKFSIDSGCI